MAFLLVQVLPVLYIGVSLLSLTQISIILHALANLHKFMRNQPSLKFALPGAGKPCFSSCSSCLERCIYTQPSCLPLQR